MGESCFEPYTAKSLYCHRAGTSVRRTAQHEGRVCEDVEARVPGAPGLVCAAEKAETTRSCLHARPPGSNLGVDALLDTGGLPASPPPPPVLDTRGPRSLVPTACVPGNLITLTPLLLSTQRGLSLYWLCCVSQRGLGTGLPTPRLSQSTRQLQRGEACAHQTAE